MRVEDGGRIDTIVARATGPVAAALAVIRLSGPGAIDLLRGLAPQLSEPPPARAATLLRLVSPGSGRPLDHALVTVFPAPASYTGEDVVEISCHGGTSVVEGIEAACLTLGARRAGPGEFTRRAVANGKLDLLQAEAVADLVEGRNAAQQDAALHHLERGLSRRIARIRQELVGLEALLVQHLDFPDEDEAPVPLDRVAASADEVLFALDTLLSTAPGGTLLRDGALVVLAGRPNAGKSSLFNALVGEERAIVTDEPGTTRDALEVPVSLGGFPFRIVDTAGLREGGGRVERLGIEVAHRYLERADVVVMCIEAGREMGPDEAAFLEARGDRPTVVVRTKADVGGAVGSGSRAMLKDIQVSVETGEGLGDLMDLLRDRVYGDVALAREGEAPVITRQRQVEGLRKARGEVAAFAEGIRSGLPAEVASTHLRPAETALEELVGIIPRDEILDVLFREFCIGK